MKVVQTLFRALHAFTALLFACAALVLMSSAAQLGWTAIADGLDHRTALLVIEAVGLLAAAVVALQIAETITEEEVIRDVQISAPTRVRRFLSRFFVVVVVALALEGLVATFKALHEDPAQLPYAAWLLLSVGGLLAAWGVFIHYNREAELLEPEAMEAAKREDKKVDH